MSDELKIQNECLFLAFTRKYEELKKRLSSVDTHVNEIHDHIARIAVRTHDRKLFDMTNHHQRIIMEDFANGDASDFKFIMEIYEDIDIPSYVYKNLSVENAKYLLEIGKPPDKYDLEECSNEVKKVFKKKTKPKKSGKVSAKKGAAPKGEKPKRPSSSYAIFSKSRRNYFKKEHPDMTFSEISKSLATEWKELTEKEKRPFQKEAEKSKAKYDKEMKAYDT